MSSYAKDLNTAEVAYAAIQEVNLKISFLFMHHKFENLKIVEEACYSRLVHWFLFPSITY